jgi:hypothetical protein
MSTFLRLGIFLLNIFIYLLWSDFRGHLSTSFFNVAQLNFGCYEASCCLLTDISYSFLLYTKQDWPKICSTSNFYKQCSCLVIIFWVIKQIFASNYFVSLNQSLQSCQPPSSPDKFQTSVYTSRAITDEGTSTGHRWNHA